MERKRENKFQSKKALPMYRPTLIKHMCMMEEEHNSTSQVTQNVHKVVPKGQYPVNRKKRFFKLFVLNNQFVKLEINVELCQKK